MDLLSTQKISAHRHRKDSFSSTSTASSISTPSTGFYSYSDQQDQWSDQSFGQCGKKNVSFNKNATRLPFPYQVQNLSTNLQEKIQPKKSPIQLSLSAQMGPLLAQSRLVQSSDEKLSKIIQISSNQENLPGANNQSEMSNNDTLIQNLASIMTTQFQNNLFKTTGHGQTLNRESLQYDYNSDNSNTDINQPDVRSLLYSEVDSDEITSLTQKHTFEDLDSLLDQLEIESEDRQMPLQSFSLVFQTPNSLFKATATDSNNNLAPLTIKA